MSRFKGIELVDPSRLEKQHTLTKTLWATLRKEGVKDGARGRIEVYFLADSEESATELAAGFREWESEIAHPEDANPRYGIQLITPEVNLTEEAFLDLVDVSMIAAHNHGCQFEGFQVAMPEIGESDR